MHDRFLPAQGRRVGRLRGMPNPDVLADFRKLFRKIPLLQELYGANCLLSLPTSDDFSPICISYLAAWAQ
jgi:hypothetical protein